MSDRFVVLSGCSGGGKSTLLGELCRRGYATVAEPGRRIVKEENASGGTALPWRDLAAFARRAMEVATADLNRMRDQQGWVFFDRGVVDGAAALQHATSEPVLLTLGDRYRYHDLVFLVPPWPDLFVSDAERQHDFDAAVAEYERLEQVYSTLGYRTMVLPRASVSARADIVLEELGMSLRE